MTNSIQKAIVLCLISMGVSGLMAQTVNTVSEFKVEVQKTGAIIQPTMYGAFFEDINFGADGGLYAELIKNRSFEFDNPFSGWTPFGHVTIQTKNPCFSRNPHYAELSYDKELTGTGLDNEGFRGVGVKKDEKYNLSFYARVMGKSPVKLRVNLVNYGNDFIEEKEIELKGQGWQKYTVVLMPASNCPHARFRITMIDRGTIDLEHISLFPQKTFNNRPNGLRQDLAQALKDLHPGIFRFPGGCIVEGTNKATRYQWKNTVGPVENRPTNINRWNYTFQNKKFSDYYQSYGLGFYEFFQLSEDIGAEPLPVLNCGLSCQYENDDPNENCAVDKLQPYIDDALDLIEFANGPVSSKWGKLRLDMGHPAPFNLKFVAVGNEQWGKLYTERLEPFVKAIRARYPDIKIVGGAGPQAEGSDFEYLWPEMRRLKIDLVDEHFYRSPDWFLSNAKRYDSYDRQGPKVFAGEYACHPGNRENSFLTALCEAAFMTGFERNADVVNLCTYAPLFAHVDAWQWRPDLIWFDNTSVVKTPNYYVQQLYGMNKGTNVLSLTMNNEAVTGQNGLYATASVDKTTNDLIIKIANTGILNKKVRLDLEGLSEGKHQGKLTVLQSMDLEAKNTIAKPSVVEPVTTDIELSAPVSEVTLRPFSFSVYRVRL